MPHTIFVVFRGTYEDTRPIASFADRDDAERYCQTRREEEPGESFEVGPLAHHLAGEQPQRQEHHRRRGLVQPGGEIVEETVTAAPHYDEAGEGPLAPVGYAQCYEPGRPAGTRLVDVSGGDAQQVEQRYLELVGQARAELAATADGNRPDAAQG